MSLDQYRERLVEWVKAAAEREGNVNTLQQEMTVVLANFGKRAPAPQHLYRWHDGDISEKIKDPTLEKVGIYRAVKEFNVPVDKVDIRQVREQTRAWLEGTDLKVEARKDEPQHPAFKYLKAITSGPQGKALIPELITFLVSEWKSSDGLVQYQGGTMPANAVSDLLRGATQEMGGPEKVSATTGIPVDRLKQIEAGDPPTQMDELIALSKVLPGFEATDLAALLSSDLGLSVES